MPPHSPSNKSLSEIAFGIDLSKDGRVEPPPPPGVLAFMPPAAPLAPQRQPNAMSPYSPSYDPRLSPPPVPVANRNSLSEIVFGIDPSEERGARVEIVDPNYLDPRHAPPPVPVPMRGVEYYGPPRSFAERVFGVSR